jgi:hypothetical protein
MPMFVTYIYLVTFYHDGVPEMAASALKAGVVGWGSALQRK